MDRAGGHLGGVIEMVLVIEAAKSACEGLE
jgi:hypothetical protein